VKGSLMATAVGRRRYSFTALSAFSAITAFSAL